MSLSLRLLAMSAAFAFAGTSFASPQSSVAAPATKTLSAQQRRMGDCNTQASGKKNDERKAFMSSCLKGQAAAPMATTAKATQQQKMTRCNADAKSKALKGTARKTFMSTCLKNAPISP